MDINNKLVVGRYGIAFLAFSVALALRFQLTGILPPYEFPFLTFYPAVLLTAYFAGTGPGLLVSGLSVLAAWRYLGDSPGSFDVPSFGDQVALLFFGSVLVLQCLLVRLLHRALAKAQKYSDQATRLAKLSRKNELTMDAILEAMPAAIIVADKNGRPVRMNAATQRIWGEAPDTSSVDEYAQWKGWWADGSARQGQPLQAHEWGLAHALAGASRTQMVEIEPFGRPGERVMTLLSAAPIRDRVTGEVSGGVVAQIDMTESFKAQRALRESDAKFHTLADNIPQLAWMADADGTLTWYNNRWLEYTGKTIEEMQGVGWRDVHHPDYVGPVTKKIIRHIRSGLIWEDTFPLKGRDGNYRWFLSRAVPIKDENGKIVNWFGTNTDVTDQRKLEEDLRLADRHKDDFLAMLAHELRNPLAPIVAAVELLSIAAPDDARIRLTTDIIGRQARHLSSLVDDLLDVSRLRRGLISLQRIPVTVQSLIEAAIEQSHPAITARAHTFTCRMAQTDVWINADANRLIQVFANLLNNAAKYTPEGGHIEVSLDANGSEVNFAVQDNGIGMRPELLFIAFELFTQGERSPDRTQGGLGIGLALVKSLVEMHGGTVAVSSAGPGLGCRFDVTLPRWEAPGTTPAS